MDVAGDGRNSFGYIGQLIYSPPTSKFIIGGSFGENHLKRTDADKTADGTDSEILKRRAIVGQITYKWSKSLRWVAEYGHIDGYGDGAKTSKGDQGSARHDAVLLNTSRSWCVMGGRPARGGRSFLSANVVPPLSRCC